MSRAIVAALPTWVERCVRSRLPHAVPPDVMVATELAAEAARRQVGAEVEALLAQDIDEQRTTPLSLLRGAVRYPTEVLRSAGVPPRRRQGFDVERFPDDEYELTPANLADVDPELAELGLVWGAAKAWTHKARHQPRGPS